MTSNYVVFDREDFMRWWQQPSVGGTDHGPDPLPIGLEPVGWQALDGEVMGIPHPSAERHFDLTRCEPVYRLRGEG